MNQKIIFQLFIVFYFSSCQGQIQQAHNPLQLITSVSLKDVTGRIDHIAYDQKHNVVFVAALGNNTIEVIDLNSKSVVHSIKNLHEPQGIIFIPESNSILVANGGNGACDVFDATTFEKRTYIKLPGDADNVRYDEVKKRIYVGYGDGGIAIINATNLELLNKIELDAHPESFQIDKAADKIYINVPDKKEIEVIDLDKNTVMARWKLNEAGSNFPMALDERGHRLFIGCRSPATLLVIDTQSGKEITSVTCTGDADDIFYDNNLVFVSAGKGYIDVFQIDNNNTIKEISKTETRSGARTSLLLPAEKKLLLAVPARNDNPAELSVYNF